MSHRSHRKTKTGSTPSIGHKMGLFADLFYECENDRGYSGDETMQNNTTHLSCCQLPQTTLVEQQEKFISFDRFSLRLDCLLAATESETLPFCTALCSPLEK